MEAGQFVQVLQHRQGVMIACLEEIAMRRGFITVDQAFERAAELGTSSYGTYLERVATEYVAEGRPAWQ